MTRKQLLSKATGLALAIALSGLCACTGTAGISSNGPSSLPSSSTPTVPGSSGTPTISQPPYGLTQTITLPGTFIAVSSSTSTNEPVSIQFPDINNFLIVKYGSGGATLWQDLINIPNQTWNLPLNLDAAGNAYIVSPDFNIKYNSDGQQLYLNTFTGSSFWSNTSLVDRQGNIFLAGYSDVEQIVLVKFDSAGKLVWEVHYQYPGSTVNDVEGIALDPSGNVYIVGVSSPSKDFNAGNLLILKYDGHGQLLWAVKDNGQMQGGPRAAPVVDSAGNVYATGSNLVAQTKGPDGLTVFNFDYVTVKYNNQGMKQWERNYDGPYNGYDSPHDLKVDAAGDVIVTGESDSQDGLRQIATVKYDKNGNELWVSRYNADKFESTPVALAVDDQGNIYITGRVDNYPSGGNYLTIKYDTGGRQLWEVRYNGTGRGNLNEASAMFVDSLGDVYVTGTCGLDSGFVTFDTIKYSPDGVKLWVASYNKTYFNGGLDKLIVDTTGNVYVIGRVTDPNLDLDPGN